MNSFELMNHIASLWSLSARGEELRNLERQPLRKELAWLIGNGRSEAPSTAAWELDEHSMWSHDGNSSGACQSLLYCPETFPRTLGGYWVRIMPVWWNNLPRERKRAARIFFFLRLGKHKTKWTPKSLVAKSWMWSLIADGWSEYWFQGCDLP